jgi:PLP dependent protein
MKISFEDFERNLSVVLEKIAGEAKSAQRNSSEIKLLAVTKYLPIEMLEWMKRTEIFGLGENKVQSALEKGATLTSPLRWELIGHLQTNKVRDAVRCFSRIQSVDSSKLLAALQSEAIKQGRISVPILLQINTANDPAKFGADPSDAPALLEAALACPNLSVEGLMCLGALEANEVETARTFANLRQLRDQLSVQFGIPLSELSMGMSGDFETAIREGSTLVRIGRRFVQGL